MGEETIHSTITETNKILDFKELIYHNIIKKFKLGGVI